MDLPTAAYFLAIYESEQFDRSGTCYPSRYEPNVLIPAPWRLGECNRYAASLFRVIRKRLNCDHRQARDQAERLFDSVPFDSPEMAHLVKEAQATLEGTHHPTVSWEDKATP